MTEDREHGTTMPCWCGSPLFFLNPRERKAYVESGMIEADDPHVVISVTIPKNFKM